MVKLDLILKILAWSLMTIGLAIIFLKLAGIIKSPEDMLVNALITSGMLLELGRLEEKVSLLWIDFKKRKRI
jgi:hypothetical protein